MFNCMITFNFLRILRRRNKAANEVDFSRSLKLMEWLLQSVGAPGRLRALNYPQEVECTSSASPPSVVHFVNTDERRGQPADSDAQVLDGVVQLGYRETSWQGCTSQPFWHFTNATCTHLLAKNHTHKTGKLLSPFNVDSAASLIVRCQLTTCHCNSIVFSPQHP